MAQAHTRESCEKKNVVLPTILSQGAPSFRNRLRRKLTTSIVSCSSLTEKLIWKQKTLLYRGRKIAYGPGIHTRTNDPYSDDFWVRRVLR